MTVISQTMLSKTRQDTRQFILSEIVSFCICIPSHPDALHVR